MLLKTIMRGHVVCPQYFSPYPSHKVVATTGCYFATSPHPMSSERTVLRTSLGALEGAVSVLLTCLAGYVAVRRGLLNRLTVKQVSKLCTALFLPCLLIVQMGPELTVSSLSRYWIIPLWGLFSTAVGYLIGWAGQRLFGLKYWTIIACGRPNSNVLPLS